ncbi:hypothetical protein F4678DRAFT_459929 [Xylaria arbuscula]|nr:hypothetical protein F4678DRAFT_459929 [Xylaria arbuscula]
MSILFCCHNRQSAEKETQTEPISLPTKPPRARLSKPLSRSDTSDTNMYLSSILASRGPSQLVIPAYHNIVDPDAVEVDDSDDDGPSRDTPVPNAGALGLFRTKLIRRLSHRPETKIGSRPSVGTSDEELARRAELKRLMHKRIQDELKSEEEEDDDDDDDLRLAPLGPQSVGNCKEPELPGGGPRDTIEFSVSTVDEEEPRKEADTSSDPSFSQPPVTNGPQEPCRHQSSCSDLAGRSIDNSFQECGASLDDVRTVIRPPSSPPITPDHQSRGSGRDSLSAASWRLSYSELHIESYIEPLVEARQVSRPQSLDIASSFSKLEDDTTHPHEIDTTTNYSNPTTQNEYVETSQTMRYDQDADPERNLEGNYALNDSAETTDGRLSPMDVWLRSHYALILPSRSHTEMDLDRSLEWDIGEQIERLQDPDNSVDLPGHKERTTDSSLILQDPTSSAGLKALKRVASNEQIEPHQVLRIENYIIAEEPHMEDQTQDISSRYTSSRYTTRPNSQQPTPRGSYSSLTETTGNRKVLQPLTLVHGSVGPYHLAASDNSDISSYRTALNKTPLSDHTKLRQEVSQLPTAEAISISASETASFRQREEELKSIKKRFGLTPACRYPKTPVYSKFREEFGDPKAASSSRTSILSKLHLVFPRKSRASSSHTEVNRSDADIEMRATDCRNLSYGLNSNKYQCPTSDMEPETAAGKRVTILLQRHKNNEDDDRAGRLKAKFIRVSGPKANMATAETRPIHLNNANHANETTLDSVRIRFPAQTSNDPKGSSEAETKNNIDIHAGVLQEWVEQLHAEDEQRKSRTESRISVPKRQPIRLRTPPGSWAKWPSHTRQQRTAPAGERDMVSTRDFAPMVESYRPEDKRESQEQSTESDTAVTSRNLSGQVSKALKYGWNKMITHTGSLGRASNRESATQTTQQPHEFLEYPELKLLPTAEGYKDVQAIDRQIDTMKRRSTPGRRGIGESSSDGTRRLLASRIAEEVHKFQIPGEDIAWTDIRYRAKVPLPAQFLSPTDALRANRPEPFDPKLLGILESQCVYDDCVQTQMLDDGDNNDTAQNQHKATIKRAKSTGNIEAELPGDEDDPTRVQKTKKLGLRRHKSLGWIRGRGLGDHTVGK